MMMDSQTNIVFLADSLFKTYPSFARRFTDTLTSWQVPFGLLPGTRDVWAKDYMPIQSAEDTYVQFTYAPDYLKAKRYQHLRTDPSVVTRNIGIATTNCDLILDGGNVIQGENFVVLTDKVFQENRHLEKRSVYEILERIFQRRIVIIPRDPSDYTGHADGMVRAYGRSSVLINRYQQSDTKLAKRIHRALQEAGLEYIEVAYNPYRNSSNDHAIGYYINFLELENIIFLPAFGLPADESALDAFIELYPSCRVVPVLCDEVAEAGGVLNCISWNIRK